MSRLALHRLLVLARRSYQGPLPILAGSMLALCAVTLLWPYLREVESYPEPIAGLDTLYGASKVGDYRAYALLLGLGILLCALCGFLVQRLGGSRGDSERRGATHTVLLLALIPSVAWLAGAFTRSKGMGSPLFAGAFLLAGTLLIAALGRRGVHLPAERIPPLGALGLLIVFLASLGGLGVASLLSRTPFGARSLLTPASGLPWIALGLGAAAVLTACLHRSPADGLEARLKNVLLLAQAPLPLLYTVLIPPPIRALEGRTLSESTVLLTVLVAIVVVVAMALWVRAWLGRPSMSGQSWRPYLSPLALCALPAFVAGPTYGDPALPADVWHTGEQMLPWQQWRSFGSLPYVDIHLMHGFSSALRGLLNDLLFDGTVVGFAATQDLVYSVVAVATFGLAWALAGFGAALAIALAATFAGPQLLLLAPAILVLGLPWLAGRPALWLGIWTGLCVLLPAYTPASGVAFVLGSLPVAVAVALQALRKNPRHILLAGAAIVVASGALVLGTALGQIAGGFVTFFVDNLHGYSQTAGIAAELRHLADFRSSPIGSPFGLDLLRFGFVPLSIAILGLVARELGFLRRERKIEVLLLGCLALGSSVALSRWAIGRIDPDHWSRSGALTALLACQLLPVLLLLRCDGWRRGVIIGMAVAAAASVLEVSPLLRDGLEPLVQKASAARRLYDPGAPPTASAVRVPVLGMLESSPAAAPYLRLKGALDALLQPDETFYVLSNDNMLYVYMNRRVPAPYPSSYYAATPLLQRRTLESLERHPVPLAVLGPPVLGGEPTSVRSYALVRHFLLRYCAVARSGFTLLVDPTRVPQAGPIGSEEQLRLLDAALRTESLNLGAIPAMWGRSWSSMQEQFTQVAELSQLHDAATFDLRSHGLRGQDADYLLLTFVQRGPAADDGAALAIEWRAEGQPTAGLRFDTAPPVLERDAGPRRSAEPARYLVPLGSHPRWFLSARLEQVSVRPLNPATAGPTLEQAVLLRGR